MGALGPLKNSDIDELIGIGTAGQLPVLQPGGGLAYGEATIPSGVTLLAVRGDSDTGLSSPSADVLAVTAGGVEGLRIEESAGEVTWPMDVLPLFHKTTANSIAIGKGATVRNSAGSSNHTAIGVNASTVAGFNNSNATAIGAGATVDHNNATAVGALAHAGASAIAIGSNASADTGVAIGANTTSSQSSLAIGLGPISANINHQRCIAIGNGVATERDDEFVFGGRNSAQQQPSIRMSGSTDQFRGRDLARILTEWVDATDATRKARSSWNVYDTVEREVIRIEGTGSAAAIGFLGASAVVQQPHIPDPTGGSTIDAEARTAINSVLKLLEDFGFKAKS